MLSQSIIWSSADGQSIDSFGTCTDGAIAFSASSLGGNLWTGNVGIMDVSNKVKSIPVSSGCSSIVSAGNSLIVARDDGDIGMYSQSTLETIDIISAHDDIVSCLALSASNEDVLVSGGHDSNLVVWDLSLAEESLLIPQAHYGEIYDVAFQRRSSTVFASTGLDGLLRCWDTRQGKDVVDVTSLQQVGSSLLFSDETVLAVGLRDGGLRFYDVRQLDAGAVGEYMLRSDVRRLRRGWAGKVLAVAGAGFTVVDCAKDTLRWCEATRGPVHDVAVLSLKEETYLAGGARGDLVLISSHAPPVGDE